MLTVIMTIYITADNWQTLIVSICSYSVFYVVYMLIYTYNTEWYLKSSTLTTRRKVSKSFENNETFICLLVKL